MGNVKIKFQPTTSKEREEVLGEFKNMLGYIPEGYDDELFLSAVVKIRKYLKKNFAGKKVSAQSIPDVNEFPVYKSQYSMIELAMNRIAKNVKKVVNTFSFNENAESSATGKFIPKDKQIRIYRRKIKTNLESLLSDYNGVFKSESDFKKCMTMSTIVHEILHSISYTGKSNGFKRGKEGVSLTEGMTESLALEVCGLKDCYRKSEEKAVDVRNNYKIRTRTKSAYVFETNIVTLLRIATGKQMTIDYLVDGRDSRDKILARYPHARLVLEELDYYKSNKIKTNNQYTEEFFKNFRAAQSEILRDIFARKVIDKRLEEISNLGVGSYKGKNKYEDLLNDLNFMGNCIMSEIPNKSRLFDKVQTDPNATRRAVSSELERGNIAPTANVGNYLMAIDKAVSVGKDLGLGTRVQ